MTKKNTISKISRLGIAGALVFGAAGAMAEKFNATTTVQNALAVTNVADLDLGTVFATSASDAEAAYFTVGTDGVVSDQTAANSDNFQLLSLGTPVPAQASVAVGSQTPFTVTLPDAEGTADANAKTVISSGAPVYLCAGGACGNTTIPRLELINFRLGALTNGSLPASATVSTSNVATISPSFGATDVGFSIGATVITDTNLDTSRTGYVYEPTTYTGTFEVTASY